MANESLRFANFTVPPAVGSGRGGAVIPGNLLDMWQIFCELLDFDYFCSLDRVIVITI